MYLIFHFDSAKVTTATEVILICALSKICVSHVSYVDFIPDILMSELSGLKTWIEWNHATDVS